MKKRFLLLFLVGLFMACEKDDICSGTTPTTPRLVISFFDTETTLPRNVKNLKVIGTEMEEGVILTPAATGDARFLSNANTISIPLRTLRENTEYRFIYNFGDSNPNSVKTDTIAIHYTTRDIYVSRACGYKTLFTLISPGGNTDPIELNNGKAGTWIDNFEILQSNIETEDETHIKIFFN